jgi:hypothetical protein
LKRDSFLWFPLACLSWALAWNFQDEFISDWDGFDYTAYTVQHLPSALGLGRALFLGYNSLIWEIAHRYFDVQPEQAYLVIRYGVIAQTGVAIIGVYALAKELCQERLSAFLGALIVASSPYFIFYSGRSMSEIPGFLSLAWSLWWMFRSLRRAELAQFLIASSLIGLSANIREFSVFYLPLIPLAARLYGLKWRFAITALGLAGLCAFLGMIFWSCYDPDNYLRAVFNWYQLSANERRAHPVTIENLRFFLEFAFNCSAIVVILTPLAFVQLRLQIQTAAASEKQRYYSLLLTGLTGLSADVILIANHDLSVNPRYLLIGLFGLAPLCGWSLGRLIRQRGVFALPLLLGLAMITKGIYNHTSREQYNQQWAARSARGYIAKIERMPWNAGFIVGARSPLIHYLAGVGARPYWRTIASGADWPGEKLDAEIQEFFYAGRLVYVDFDPDLWQPGARRDTQATEDLERLKTTYKLRHVEGELYQVLEYHPPMSDKQSSLENPNK